MPTGGGTSRPKVGLYTSPHIVSERERIRIDFAPISESLFAHHFFHVWHTILRDVGGDVDRMPGYLQLLALLSAYVFRVEGVALAVYEVHAGGRYCSTNLWDAPVACGINTVGLDHVGLLGNNIAEIAWNKAGIMKPACRAFSVAQVPEAREQLVREADALGCPLVFVDEPGSDQSAVPADVARLRPELAIPGPRSNLALAVHLANAYLATRGEKLTQETVGAALRQYQWPGRFQVVEPSQGARTRWYLDFAHNDISLPVALDWFKAEVARFQDGRHGAALRPAAAGAEEEEEASGRAATRVLVFGHHSRTRDTGSMAEVISQHSRVSGLRFDHVILAGHSRRVSGRAVFDYDEAQQVLEVWKDTAGWGPEVDITFSATIQEAMDLVERMATAGDGGGADGGIGAHALIVGSSHLVSSAVAAMPGRADLLG